MFSIGKKVIAKNQPKKPAKLTFEQQLANFIEYQKKHEQEQQDESDEEVPVPEEDKKTESKGLEKLHLPRGGKSVSVQPELVKENPCVSCPTSITDDDDEEEDTKSITLPDEKNKPLPASMKVTKTRDPRTATKLTGLEPEEKAERQRGQIKEWHNKKPNYGKEYRQKYYAEHREEILEKLRVKRMNDRKILQEHKELMKQQQTLPQPVTVTQ